MAKSVKKIFRSLRDRFRRNYPYTFDDMLALSFGKKSWREDYALKLSTVYRCVTCISDSVAQLPLEIFSVDKDGYKRKLRSHPLARLLNQKPNNRMTRYTFISMVIGNILLNGNFFAFIKRDKKRVPEQLIYIPGDFVTIKYPSTLEEHVKYVVTFSDVNGQKINEEIDACDMLHFINRTTDGVLGESVVSYASETLGLSHSSEKHAANFFESGCGIGGILKSNTRLNDEQTEQIRAAWNSAFSQNGGQSNGVAVLGASLDYQPVTVNARDAQLLETRAFNVIDICRFFGVSPVKAFDLSKSSYSTVEATNIGFLTDTISPLLEKIELEMETKLFKPEEHIDVRFDVSQLLRADKQSLAAYYSTMYQIGAISTNEIRREIDLPPVEGGDNNLVQVNLTPLKDIGKQQDEGAQGAGNIPGLNLNNRKK